MNDFNAAESDSPAPEHGESVLSNDRRATEMTRQQRAEAKEYGRRELHCSLIDMAIDLVYLATIAFFAATIIDSWLLSWPIMANRWIRLGALYLITVGIHYALSFPLSFYAGFLLEHKYQLSRQSFGRWLWRYALQNLLTTAFGLIMVLGLFAIIWWAGPWWWLVAAAATFVVTVLMGQFVPVLILPLFYKIERLEDEELTDRLRRLAEGTSLNLQGVFRMKLSSETVKANALLEGLGQTRRVILGDTLLERFTPAEIEVVFAHEVGHHVYHHISKLIGLGIAHGLLGFFLCDRMLVAWVGAQEGSFDYANVPAYALPMLLFVVTLLSLILSPLRNALSRRFETVCDRYALERTGKPEAYRSAFSKLAQLNKADPDPHPLEVFLMHDHPPVSARLALADEVE